jgi:voltage-gated sodium channel
MNDAVTMRDAAASPDGQQGNAFLQRITGSSAFKIFILLCVVANAILLGYDAHHGPNHPHHKIVDQWNHYFLYLFTVELILEFFAAGPRRYFKDGWNCFDFFIVAAGYLAFIPGVTAMRALRALRVFRLISNVPQMRRVVEALAHALPGIGSALLVMSIVFFIGAVMATTLFRSEDGFHNLGESMISLMQLAFFDNWGDMVRSLNESHPGGWLFLVIFTLISAFAIINLFIGVIVDAVQQMPLSGPKNDDDPAVIQAQILAEVRALRAEVAALRSQGVPPPA